MANGTETATEVTHMLQGTKQAGHKCHRWTSIVIHTRHSRFRILFLLGTILKDRATLHDTFFES